MSENILTINEIKKKIIPVCKKYDIPEVYLFGSYASGNATKKSDIDLVIGETEKIYSLFDMVDATENFENALNKKVIIITINSLKENKHFTKIVKETMQEIYRKES